MKAMANKGFRNGRATMDNGYGMFLRFLEYKLHDRGKVFIKVSRWFPSSQICHVCGKVDPELKDLRIRHWTCPGCGSEHDRDAGLNTTAISMRPSISFRKGSGCTVSMQHKPDLISN